MSQTSRVRNVTHIGGTLYNFSNGVTCFLHNKEAIGVALKATEADALVIR